MKSIDSFRELHGTPQTSGAFRRTSGGFRGVKVFHCFFRGFLRRLRGLRVFFTAFRRILERFQKRLTAYQWVSMIFMKFWKVLGDFRKFRVLPRFSKEPQGVSKRFSVFQRFLGTLGGPRKVTEN